MKDRYFAFCNKCEQIKEIESNKYGCLCVDCNLNPMIIKTLKGKDTTFKFKGKK